MSYTDYDRLQAVAEGRLVGRGRGDTFLICHTVAGMVELGKDNILICVTRLSDIDYIHPMLREVFNDHDIHLERLTPYLYRADFNKRIKIITEDQLESYRAVYSAVVVYMRHED